MTGMVTAALMPSIISGSLMRATPPSRRMSDGTRSSAMTAVAPASSAMRASSAVTTSMMTPPLSISARPRLTSVGAGLATHGAEVAVRRGSGMADSLGRRDPGRPEAGFAPAHDPTCPGAPRTWRRSRGDASRASTASTHGCDHHAEASDRRGSRVGRRADRAPSHLAQGGDALLDRGVGVEQVRPPRLLARRRPRSGPSAPRSRGGRWPGCCRAPTVWSSRSFSSAEIRPGG